VAPSAEQRIPSGQGESLVADGCSPSCGDRFHAGLCGGRHRICSASTVIVSVLLGDTQTFAATVTNASDTGVTWSVNGVPGGISTTGTITAAGVYTAPADLPSPSIVQVTATSSADATRSSGATVTVASDVSVNIAANPGSMELGATQAFRAAIASNGHPDTSVRWSLSGAACAPGCGAIDANGNYTAPQVLPIPATATLIAQSVADPSKQSSAPLTITSNFLLQISAPSSVPVSGTATIAATLTPVPGSKPSTALAWSVSGPGCSGGLTRPSGGTATADICLFSQSGLDASMSYVISGPGELTVIGKQPAGLGIIHLTLQIAATTAPGARTLFVQNTNLDKTAASGALEVQ